PEDLRGGLHRLLADVPGRGPGRSRARAADGHRRHRAARGHSIRAGGGVVTLLRTDKLTKYFGDTHAVDHVDFTVAAGEVLALIGSNGAGKTTLVNLISGLIPVDSGRITFEGTDITSASIHAKIELGIARSFQLVNLFDQLTALDNVALAIFSRERKTR